MACLDLPGIVQHVVQCGPGRTGRFDNDDDRAGYLRELAAAAHAEYCHLHAYALLDRHAHLLLTPVAPGHAIRMMRALERRLVRPFAWRCHSLPPFDDGAVLACQRRIELAPVRAGLASHPGHYRWASYAGHASPVPDPILQPHRAWLALGRDAAARERAWAAFVEAGLCAAVAGPCA
jgi:putative transposase